MKQRTLAMMTGFEQYTRKTRRAIFLEEMEQVVPWRELCALVEPFYPKPGNGRPPIEVERMLRIYFLQQWFNLSEPGGGGGALRFVGDAPLCRYRSRLRAGARRDDGVPLPSPARGARSGPAAVRGSAATLGGEGTEGGHRHDCRCDNHQCAVVEQECRQGTRSRDAPDQEGQPMVFRDEGAFRDRQPNQADPRGGGHTGQCRRQHGAARSAARQ